MYDDEVKRWHVEREAKIHNFSNTLLEEQKKRRRILLEKIHAGRETQSKARNRLRMEVQQRHRNVMERMVTDYVRAAKYELGKPRPRSNPSLYNSTSTGMLGA